MIFDIDYYYVNTFLIILNLIESILLVYILTYIFEINFIKQVPLILLLFLEFLFINNNFMVYIMILTMIIYIYFVDNIKNLSAVLFPTLSMTIYTCSLSIEKLITYNSVVEYTNIFETIVIQCILIFLIKEILKIKTNFSSKTIINFIISCISIVYILNIFIKLMLNQEINQIEIIGFGCSAIMICILLFQYILLFDEIIILNESLNDKSNNNKFMFLNKIEFLNKYNLNNQLNHNMKYTLLNIKLYLEKQKYDLALEYINTQLKTISSNKLCFTNNPYFDYIINEYDERLKRMNITIEKDIFIENNSYINEEKNVKKIKEYLENQLNILKINKQDFFHLSIHQKGELIIIKSIFDKFNHPPINVDYNYETNDELLITKLIIERNE